MKSIRLMAVLVAALVLLVLGAQKPAQAQNATLAPQEVLQIWQRLILELVRHTATYSPPVASRAFAYVGVTAFEAVASGNAGLQSLAGQLNALQPLPQREVGQYDEATVMHAALNAAVQHFFDNTGPTGQRAMQALGSRLRAQVVAGLPSDVVARSEAHGQAVAAHIVAWAASDGGAVIENMGFPFEYQLTAGAGHWVPTSLVIQQQKPLLPNWGKNRTFAMPSGASCPLPAPPVYSEDKESPFYKEALEVYQTSRNLTGEQRAVARFWSDDPMLSPTPPGHWVSIALQILKDKNADVAEHVEVLARLGVTLADAFVGCWNTKYQYDLLRPITYIRRVIDPKWEPILNTPPFPEYPSGHSTQSGAAAAVLSSVYGENFAFEDNTHQDDGLAVRAYPNFWAAANEAALSRLYGGIHFRAAIERGLQQGRCVGAHAIALRTRK